MNTIAVHVPLCKTAKHSRDIPENVNLPRSAIFSLLSVLVIYLLSFSELRVVQAAEREDVYVGLYFLSGFPIDEDARLRGNVVPNTDVAPGFGAGFKAGLFPDFSKRMVGMEIEWLGHNTEVAFRQASQSATSRTNLWIFGTMLNLVVRLPLDRFTPYGGIGAGLSQGILSHADIPGRDDRDFETSPTLGHQFFAGVQADLSERVFCFGEYKYLAANYHWEALSLDFRAQYAVIGLGLRF